MATFQFDVQSRNFNHMSFFQDYNNENPKSNRLCVNKNSISDYILKNCKKFAILLEKAQSIGKYDSEQADYTIFIPTDKALQNVPFEYFTEMDVGTAHQILNASTMNRVIDKKILISSPIFYLDTLNKVARLFITNINNQCMLNKRVTIYQFNIKCANGMIHLTDNLLIPTLDKFEN